MGRLLGKYRQLDTKTHRERKEIQQNFFWIINTILNQSKFHTRTNILNSFANTISIKRCTKLVRYPRDLMGSETQLESNLACILHFLNHSLEL